MKKIIPCIILHLLSASLANVKSSSSVGPYLSTVVYNEAGIMSESSVMTGLTGFYEIYDTYGLRLEGNLSSGETHYESNRTGSMEEIPEHHAELRSLLNKHYTDQKGFKYAPYVGLGYRYLDSNASNMYSTTGHIGYDRQQTYLYSPMGIEITTPIRHSTPWHSTVGIEYDHFIHGNNESDTSFACGSPMLFDQDSGYGYRLKARFNKKMDKRTLSIEPFYKYWHIQQSDTANCRQRTYIEPENSSAELGVSFSYLF